MAGSLLDYNLTYVGHDKPEAVGENQKLVGCTFIFDEYQESEGENFLNKWIKTIEGNGGRMGQTLTDCTHLLCKTRSSHLYQQALRFQKRCVTIYWLQDVLINSKMMQYPWRALHIPLPFTHDEKPCKNQVISVTNFEGKERTELKEMIANVGATYTENMTLKNTILICRHAGGKKYKKALQWNLAVVNGTWLNDVLLGNNKAVELMLVLPKYQNFALEDPLKLRAYGYIRDIMYPWRTPINVFPHNPCPAICNGGNYENDCGNLSLSEDTHSEYSIYSHLHRTPNTGEDDGYVFSGNEKNVTDISLRRLDPNEALIEIKNIDPNAKLLQLNEPRRCVFTEKPRKNQDLVKTRTNIFKRHTKMSHKIFSKESVAILVAITSLGGYYLATNGITDIKKFLQKTFWMRSKSKQHFC